MKPSKAFSTRYAAAKKWRDGVETDIKDVLTFCANGRENDFTSVQDKVEATDIYCSYVEEFATDLASDLVTYFTPSEVRWGEFEVTAAVEQDMADQVETLVSNREDEVFGLIEASNYYDVAPQVFFEASSHGTAAMWVEKSHLTQPVFVEAVTPDELLITPGHNGHLDRFRERSVIAEFLPATFAGQNVKLDHPEIKKKISTPGATAKVCWGFWLDWSEPAVPVWKTEITVDGKRVTDEEQILGPLAGGCPLLVGRFNPWSKRPWGRGPGMKALADIFTIDKVNEIVLDNLDAALSPSWGYPDDGILDMSGGIERNAAYPMRPGTPNAIQKLDLGGNLDYGWFSEERLVDRLRVAFYQDGPRQRGDTPPSATQWLDEARRVQRRIGKPSAPLWSEMIAPFIQRVEFIAVQSGIISETITHAGDKLNVAPISPLQKAQNQDKVLTTRSNLDLAFQTFGEQVSQVVNVPATMDNIIKTSGDDLIVLNDPEETPSEPTPPAA